MFIDITKAYFNALPTRSIYVRLPKELGLPKNSYGRLLRCCYGTRDAGMLWEEAYSEILIQAGFRRGQASPTCFYHPEKQISVVCHGDDFTALGNEEDLMWYKDILARAFELGDCKVMSDDPGDCTEVKILNRILRLDSTGLRFEADPRHIELLARSLNLTQCRPIFTTGDKEKIDEDFEPPDVHDEPDTSENVSRCPISAIHSSPRIRTKKLHGMLIKVEQKLRFDPAVTYRSVVPYSRIYGVHPSELVCVGPVGSYKTRAVSKKADPFTGLVNNPGFLASRAPNRLRHEQREQRLKEILAEGANWEKDSASCLERLVQAVRKTKYVKKRIGAKAVKEKELLENTGDILDSAQATVFRALAARANYLSQDRPDASYASKELCRSFSRPTSRDVVALKHLVRYLVHSPRVVYRYDFAPEPSEMTICVDTDFAGCIRTRRSTSGGMIFIGQCLVKHWSTTQATVAISSGEAELVGIVKGATQGLGFQALAADLGFNFKIKVMSDSTAAMGICRRRGLGKVRHIAVSDLWLQERLKTGDFTLCKILGSENPADFLTKFVEKQTLRRLMPMAGLDWETGRPDAAPALTHAILPFYNIGHGLFADGTWFMKSKEPTTTAISSISNSLTNMMGSIFDLPRNWSIFH